MNHNNQIPEWTAEPSTSWHGIAPTSDQRDIQKHLSEETNKKILHVGIGDGSFPSSIDKSNKVYGISIHLEEVEHAKQNYHEVMLVNKHSDDLSTHFPKMDIIVDNNPKSYSCHQECFEIYMKNVKKMLKKGGRFITHSKGLDWVGTGGSAGYGTDEEISRLLSGKIKSFGDVREIVV
jgi:phospholipid N-methyltransferase